MADVSGSLGVKITTGTGTEVVSVGDPSPRGVAEVQRRQPPSHENMSSNDRKDDANDRRPSVQEAYASKLHAAKVHIAANAAFEAIQRVEAERAAAAAAAAAAPSAKKTGGRDAKNEKCNEMMGKKLKDSTPPKLKRSRSEPKGLKPTSGKTAVLGLIRARSETHHPSHAQNEDDESVQLHGDIHELAKQNREAWAMCDVARKGRAKPKHHTHISVVHETMVSEEEEDQNEAAKGLICFEAKYYAAVITVSERNVAGKSVVAVGIDKKNPKIITSMMAGLARSIPNQFTDWVHAREATSDGFILAYRISPTIYRLCGAPERVRVLRAFKQHLISIGTSLEETTEWLRKANVWNSFIENETYALSGTDCNSGLHNGKIEYLMLREQAEALEKKLKKNAPSEMGKVVTWQYEIS